MNEQAANRVCHSILWCAEEKTNRVWLSIMYFGAKTNVSLTARRAAGIRYVYGMFVPGYTGPDKRVFNYIIFLYSFSVNFVSINAFLLIFDCLPNRLLYVFGHLVVSHFKLNLHLSESQNIPIMMSVWTCNKRILEE